MSWLVPVSEWLVSAAVVTLPLFVAGSVAVLCLRQPVRRVRVIVLTLATCLVAPWLSRIPGWPEWSVGWPAGNREAVADRADADADPGSMPIRTASDSPWSNTVSPPPTFDASPTAEAGASEHSEAAPAAAHAPSSPSVDTASAAITWAGVRTSLAVVWLVGFVSLLVWWLVGLIALARLTRRCRPAPAACRAILEEIAGPACRRVNLLVYERVDQPFACLGSRLRPVIVLPASLCGGGPRNEQALRWCLAHEWSHIERRDLWAWLLAGVVRTVFWYQPLAWWLRRELRLGQDYIADARAAAGAGEPADYAEFLTAQAAIPRRSFAPVGLGIIGGKSDLYRRVVMLVQRQRPVERHCSGWWTALAACILLGLMTAASVIRADAQAAAQVSATGAADDRRSAHPMPRQTDSSERGPRHDPYGDPLPACAVMRLGSVRFKHPWQCDAVAVSPDGSLVASADGFIDGRIYVWNRSGERIATFPFRGAALEFTSDGKVLIAGGEADVISAWDVRTKQRLYPDTTPQPPPGPGPHAKVKAIAVPSDGDYFATIDDDAVVSVWRSTSGARIKTILTEDRLGRGRDICFSPDGKLLAFACAKGLRVVEWQSGRELLRVKDPHSDEASAIAFSPDGRSILSGGERREVRDARAQRMRRLVRTFAEIRVWDARTGERLGDILDNEADQDVDALAVVPGQDQLVATLRNTVRVWHLPTRQPVQSFSWSGKHREPVDAHAIAVSRNGETLAAAAGDHVARVWDLHTGAELSAASAGLFEQTRSLTFTPDGRELVTSSPNGTVSAWDVATGRERQRFVFSPNCMNLWMVALSPDGSLLAASGDYVEGTAQEHHNAVRIWDFRSGRLLQTLQSVRMPFCIAFISQKKLAVSYYHVGSYQPDRGDDEIPEDGIDIFEIETGKRVAQFASKGVHIMALAADPDGERLWSIGPHSKVQLWDLGTGAELKQISLEGIDSEARLGGATIQPAARLAAIGLGSELALSELPSGILRHRVEGHSDFGANVVALSQDGGLAACCQSEAFCVFNARTGHTIARVESANGIWALAFSPDGTRLASGMSDGTALIWDIEEIQKLGPNRGAPTD